MAKRAVDLSAEVLAAMGAKAARLAAQTAQNAGLIVTGTVDLYQEGQAASSLAQLHPSGNVTLVEKSNRGSAKEGSIVTKRSSDRTAE